MDDYLTQYRSSEGADQLDLFPETIKPNWFWKHLPTFVIVVVAAMLVATAYVFPALSEETHQHPPEHAQLHDQFYSKWMRPDLPESSCCNQKDCYPVEIKYLDGKLHAKRREDGKWVFVPPEKIDQVNTSPDGRNHVCMPSPSYYVPWGGDVRTSGLTSDTVYCFVYGQGI